MDELQYPGQLLGYRSNGQPIYLAAGGAEPETDDEGKDDDNETESASGEEGDKDKPKTLAELQAENARMRASLAKANKEAEKSRTTLAAERAKNESAAEAAARKAAEEAEKKGIETGESKYKPVAIRAAALAELSKPSLGFIGQAEDLVQFVDAAAITITDDGKIEGIAAEVARLKGRFPSLFNGRPAPKINPGGGQPPGGEKAKTSAERVAERFAGRRS